MGVYILFYQKIKTSCHFNNMDGTGGYYAWWNMLEKTIIVWSCLHVESRKVEFIETESRMVVSRGQEVGEIGKYWPKGKKLQL